LRAFVAIKLPDDTCDALLMAQARLRMGRKVPRENLHLTLSFLDDQPVETLEALHEEFETLRAAEFTVSLSGLGSFGGNRPRLVFADVEPNPQLDALHRQVIGAARRAGISVQRRRFHPHVTLVRLRPGADAPDRLADAIAPLSDLRFPDIPVRSIALFRSDLHPAGPVYQELASYALT
jgi:RNA 2',3'-cyclic 3'-phosphodiesterase